MKNVEAELITIKEFGIKVMLGYTRARELALSEALVSAGISVNISPEGKQKNVRINWKKYLEYIEKRPAVNEYKKSGKAG